MLPAHIIYGLAILFGVALLIALRKRQKKLAATAAAAGLESDEKRPSKAPSLDADTTLPSILLADEDRVYRGDWVIRLAGHFQARHGKRYNVLVINAAVEKIFVPEGVVEEFRTVYKSKKEKGPVTYEVYVFKRGSLVNMGDGGYINWCFFGNIDRSGMSVKFDDVVA